MNIYLYPILRLSRSGFMNPYINHLADALSEHHHVLNRNRPSSSGIFDMFKYLRRTDVVYLNWIEDLPEKRGGYLQTLVFILLLGYLKLSGKKVVWTLHNRQSHSDRARHIKQRINNLLMKHADLIITHASEGLDCIPVNTEKLFIPHPVVPGNRHYVHPEKKQYDIIIWGSITEYKGVEAFLCHLMENNLIHKYRILVAGKVAGSDLKERLDKVAKAHKNITILDRFIEENELDGLILQSRIILFCYQTGSILSSGALMDSLKYNSAIVGPEIGAFADLSREGLIRTFRDYRELTGVVDRILEGAGRDPEAENRMKEFILHNSWDSFAEQIDKTLKKL